MKWFFTIIGALFTLSGLAQSFDEIISENTYIDCKDVSFNASSIVQDLYFSNQKDKLYKFLDYWETKCGNREPITRLRTILDIDDNRFNSSSISESTLEDLMFYRRLINGNDYGNNFYAIKNDYHQSIDSLDSLIQKIASNSTSFSQDGQLILDFYSSEFPNFSGIKNAPKTSKLNSLYESYYDKTIRMWEWHYAIMTGISSHYGNISLFGTRPNFGMAFGVKKMKHNIDLVLDFRAGPSKEEYTFMYMGDLTTSDTWTGMYVGAEYTFDFFNSGKLNIGISPGLGYDRITAVNSEEDDDIDPKFLSSFNRNIGLVFKYRYGQKGGYLGLHFRYNWADYGNPGGTQLDGNYLNIRLTWGNIFNGLRHMRLKNLE